MGVSKNTGTPKRMVYRKNPIKMDDLGGIKTTPIFGNTHLVMPLEAEELLEEKEDEEAALSLGHRDIFCNCWGHPKKLFI